MEQHHHEDHHHHHHHEEDGLTLRTSTHEGAVITAYRFDLEGDPQAAQAAAEEALAAMGREVDKAGGIIGHIKAVVRTARDGVQLSLTDTQVLRRPVAGAKTTVEGVAIVFALEEKALEGIVAQAARKALEAVKDQEEA